MRTLITRALLVSFETGFVESEGAVVIEDGRIAYVGPLDSVSPDNIDAYDEVVDAGGRLVCPGFVNMHMHLYSTPACGMPVAPASSFVEVLETLWWTLDRQLRPEDLYWAAMVPLTRAIRKGFTTFFDHHSSPSAIEGSLARIDMARKVTGLRGVLCYEVSDRDGAKARDAGIEENLSFIQHAAATSDGSGGRMQAGMFGLHASFTLEQGTLETIAASSEARAAGIHVHVAEDRADVEHTKATYGQGILERFEALGLLNERSLCAHGLHLDARELERLAAAGGMLVHNPQSNMNNAVGFLDLVGRDLSAPLTCLGSDGMTSGLLEELRASIFAHHHIHQHPQAAFMEPVTLLVKNNVAAARRFLDPDLGRLTLGAPADLVVFDYLPFTPIHSGNLAGHLAFGLSQVEARDVMVAGQWLLRDRSFPHLDEEAIAARAREANAALWERM